MYTKSFVFREILSKKCNVERTLATVIRELLEVGFAVIV